MQKKTWDRGTDILREIVDGMVEGVLVVDAKPEARCVFLNRTAQWIFGAQHGELDGRLLRDGRFGALGEALDGARDRLLGGREVELLRNRFARGRWYHAVARPIGEHVLIVLRDVTEHLEAEAARRRTEQRFFPLIDEIQDYAIYMLDLRGNVASWNKGAERIKGYRGDEIIGKHYSIFFSPEEVSAGKPDRALTTAAREGRFVEEGWRVRKDGSRFWASIVLTTLHDEVGNPYGFAKITRDVTERRLADRALEESEERLRLALSSAEIGTWEFYPLTGEVLWDRRSRELWDVAPDAAINYGVFLAGVHPEDRPRVEEAIRQVLEPGSGGDYKIEFRTIGLRDRVERWVATEGKVSFDEEGRSSRFVGVVRDVTEQRRAREVRDRLAGVYAHDLRSPLQAVRMGVAVLERRELPEESRKALCTIARSADRMTRMIEQLMDFTRAHLGGGVRLDRSEIDLARVSREVVAEAALANPKRALRFAAEGHIVGLWDETRLARVLSNLLSNAVAHGCGDRPIDVLVRDMGDEVAFSVHNEGAPIPSELLPFIFDPFRRGRSDERADVAHSAGLGLGLYISKEIVVAHGGAIDVESTAGEGTTFTVRLPRATAAGSVDRGDLH